MNRVASFIPFFCILSFFFLPSPRLQLQKPETAETIDTSAYYDWDADGKPDHFNLHVQKALDYSIDSAKKSKEKFWSYHCWLTVKGTKGGTEIWSDEWSVKEDDISSFKDMADFSTNQEYFQKWFTIANNFESGKTVNTFELLRLTKDDVDADVVGGEITRLKIPGTTASQLSELIANSPKSRSFCYRATWREDLRCAVYVPKLDRALLYQNGYR